MRAMTILAVVAALLLVGSASAATASQRPYYITEMKMSNTLESRGIFYNGRRLPVDSALCLGLRRFGVRTSTYGLDRYWHFKCDVNAANGHFYEASVKTLAKPG